MVEEFETKLLDFARVTRVTAGGKHFRFRVALVIGDKRGRVGIGVARGEDMPQAIEKAIFQAKKNLIDVLIKNETIPFRVGAKHQSVKLFLQPQKKGRGIVAGGVVRKICELAGIPNITAKLLSKTKNKINIARATILAFKKIKQIEETKKNIKETKKNYATSSNSANS